MDFIDRELERLRAELDQRMREGDLAGASEIQYGAIPEVEELKRRPQFDVVHESTHRLVIEDSTGVWVAKRLGDTQDSDPSSSAGAPPLGWMKVDDALTLKERKSLILRQVHQALDRGDHVQAGRLETGALRRVEHAMRQSRTFTFLSSENGRIVLQDEHEQVHVLIPIDDV